MHISAHAYRGQSWAPGVFFDLLSPLYIEVGFLPEQELADPASLPSQPAPGISYLCFPSAGITNRLSHLPCAAVGTGDPNSHPHIYVRCTFTH